LLCRHHCRPSSRTRLSFDARNDLRWWHRSSFLGPLSQ
jgi:hypothetical protein